ncbi:uncharacterized protein LOC133903810 isoform X2 [Phragmites australis]|uniref:uncharacterized protein LOC133903810 isoform X2 n=1 Tax=Phragmites australis TaxID=29695 RepID=UPI002D7944FC|nr:uncharacterized protein LOC133903810 isoform X2 [Phragmites australis]
MLHPRLDMLLLFFVVVTANPGVAFAEDTTGIHHPPLLDCSPAPAPYRNDDSAFRANLASALGAIPSAAAAAPKGFATTRSSGAGPDRAFVRGLCFGANGSSSTDACLACLSAAARDVTRGCGGVSRRAGVWRAGCFLAYADTDASSAREDLFHGWFYAGQNATATPPDPVCTGERTAADCARCFDDSARAAAALGWLPRIHGEEVLVVGYTCFLRVQISVLPHGSGYMNSRGFLFAVWMLIIVAVAAIILGLTFLAILHNL